MNGYEFLFFMICMGAVVWYCWRVTRVSDALAEYAHHIDRMVEVDDALFLEVGRYVSDVLLPELTCRAALKQPDDEKTVAAKQLVAVLAARCAHALNAPDPLLPDPAGFINRPGNRDATQ